jgi:hypothetical protein
MSTTPTRVNSNMRNGSNPSLVMAPLTATFVEVPISVQVPPMSEAKASGMSKREGGMRSLRESPMTGPTNTAVTVVLFMKAEMPPTTAIMKPISRLGCVPKVCASMPPIMSSTPVSRKAAPMTKIAASRMITRSPKPAKA